MSILNQPVQNRFFSISPQYRGQLGSRHHLAWPFSQANRKQFGPKLGFEEIKQIIVTTGMSDRYMARYRGQGMSDTDSFIDEVTEEVRRDHLFALMKRYGWIAILVIVLIVGGAAFNEYRKASARASAEQLGDEIIAALAENEAADRAVGLSQITAGTPGSAAVLQFMVSAAKANSGDVAAAVAGLNEVARNGELPDIYRQIASFKALTLQAGTLPAADRRLQFEALAQPGAPLRLLAEEQLALIDISEGQADAAIDRLQSILQDAEVSTDLQQRVTQVIVSLGGVPDVRTGVQG